MRGSSRLIDMVGKVFGKLTVVERAGTKNDEAAWDCLCECGTHARVTGTMLRKGATKSCGCSTGEFIRQARTTHGQTKSPEYLSWRAIKARCYNPRDPYYHRYGGRGIGVCDEWRNSFEAFLRDMGYRPSLEHTIERDNNDVGYEPGNCRWATHHEQTRNKSTNRYIEFQGRTQCMSDWSWEVGIPQSVLHSRLNRGWSIARTLTTPRRDGSGGIADL